MPAIRYVRATKFFCRECGWSIVRPGGMVGDVLDPLSISLTKTIGKCSDCGCEEIGERKLGIVEGVNPIYWVRWTAHLVGRRA